MADARDFETSEEEECLSQGLIQLKYPLSIFPEIDLVFSEDTTPTAPSSFSDADSGSEEEDQKNLVVRSKLWGPPPKRPKDLPLPRGLGPLPPKKPLPPLPGNVIRKHAGLFITVHFKKDMTVASESQSEEDNTQAARLITQVNNI